MAATQHMIRQWLEDGAADGFTHMMVVCDRFDYSDYPVYRREGGEVLRREVEVYHATHSMQRVQEVYDLNRDWEEQLALHRVWFY
jgi:hypothetical protein